MFSLKWTTGGVSSIDRGNLAQMYRFFGCHVLCVWNWGRSSAAERNLYYQMAVKSGSSDAQYKFGDCLMQGVGIGKIGREDGCCYYQMSAVQGNPIGLVRYGDCILNGSGEEADPEQAARCYKLAADQDNAEGQLKYGDCLTTGTGVDADPVAAAH